MWHFQRVNGEEIIKSRREKILKKVEQLLVVRFF